MSEFIAKHFDELTAHELQQIHIIRSLVFTVGQQSTDQEPDDADFECIHMVNEDESGKVLAYLRLFDLEKVQDALEISIVRLLIGRLLPHRKHQ